MAPSFHGYRGGVSASEPSPPAPRRGVVVLGATGSVGSAAADVLEEHRGRFDVVGLAAARNGPRLLELARRLGAPVVALVDEGAAEALRPSLRRGDPEVRAGLAGVLSLVAEPRAETVLQAISGAAGLEGTIEAVRLGRRVALANKESMVVAGPIVVAEARRTGSEIVPVDSEHSAIAQCLRSGRREEVRRLILTASGGPFRGRRAADLERVTPEEALNHPTWDMGPRITVDSATLMNKALEVIEARWLFDVPPDRIEVVVHPQSLVHSMVEFVDGSVVAQMSPPDMRGPIRLALGWPDRLPASEPSWRAADYAAMSFEPPDRATFPALDLGYQAARRGGTAGAALNAADEAAVERFLRRDLPFPGIARPAAPGRETHPFTPEPSLDDVRRVDRWARERAGAARPTRGEARTAR
jgi:1-deoxy-D-xylulose-5-phosphate reductoisomerase